MKKQGIKPKRCPSGCLCVFPHLPSGLLDFIKVVCSSFSFSSSSPPPPPRQSSSPSFSPILFAKLLVNPLRQLRIAVCRWTSSARVRSQGAPLEIVRHGPGAVCTADLIRQGLIACAPLDLILQGLIAVCTAGPQPPNRIKIYAKRKNMP